MARIFAVNANNDIFSTGGNRLAVLKDLPAVLQQCQHAVETRRGEMVYAQSRGIDYLDNVFGGTPNLLLFEAQARAALSRIASVTSIVDFSAELSGNSLVYSATIQTTFGTGVINGNV